MRHDISLSQKLKENYLIFLLYRAGSKVSRLCESDRNTGARTGDSHRIIEGHDLLQVMNPILHAGLSGLGLIALCGVVHFLYHLMNN